MPTNEPRPTKAVRRDEARIKAAQMRKEQERKAKRNRIIGISGPRRRRPRARLHRLKIVSDQNANAAANSDVVYGGDSANVDPARDRRRQGPGPGARQRRHPRQRQRRRRRRQGRRRRRHPDHLLRLHVPDLRPVRADQRRRHRHDPRGRRHDDRVPPDLVPRRQVGRHQLLDPRGQRGRDRRRQGPGALRRVRQRDVQEPAGRGLARAARTRRSPRSRPTWASRRRSPTRSPTRSTGTYKTGTADRPGLARRARGARWRRGSPPRPTRCRPTSARSRRRPS